MVSVGLVLYLAFLFTGLEARLAQRTEPRDEVEITYLPSPAALDVLSLGYKTFLADILWMRVLQYHDTYRGRHVDPLYLTHYIDAILHLDPEFKRVYRWAGIAVLWASQNITAERVYAANSYLERAAERYPEDPYYPYTIGLNFAFYVPADDQKKRLQARKDAIPFLERAMQIEGAPPHIPLMIARLLALDDTERTFDFLEQAYLSEPDPNIRRLLGQRLERLDDRQRADRIRKRQRAARAWRLENYPYMRPSLFFQLGTRHDFDPSDVYTSPLPEPFSP